MEAVNESPTAAKLIPNTTTYTQPNSTEVSDHVLERTSSLRERSRTTDASSEEVGLSTETSSTGLKMEMALRPLTCTQRAVGMLLFPSVSGKKWNWRNIYPYGVLAYAWISFCRLFVLHIDPKPFGGLLFVDIMWHVIGSQTALGLTVFLFLFSPNLQRFCSKWDDYKRDHGGIPYLRVRSFCRRAVIFSLVSSTITFCTCTVSSALFGGHRMIDAIAKANLAPWCQDTCPRGLIGVSTLLGFIYTFPWSMMQVTICVLSHLLTQEFSELTVTLKKEYEANNESLPNVERNRRGHNMLCKLVHMLDDMLSVYILIIVGCYVPILVFLLYCIVYYTEYQNPNAFLLVSLALLIVMFAVLLMTIIMSAAAIHMAAIEPRRIIFDLSISGAEEPGRCLQIQLFLSKVTTDHIGLTGWRLFPVSRSTVATIVTLIVTYIVLLLKIRLSSSPNDPLQPGTNSSVSTPTSINT